jgi:hypothetical protein
MKHTQCVTAEMLKDPQSALPTAPTRRARTTVS